VQAARSFASSSFSVICDRQQAHPLRPRHTTRVSSDWGTRPALNVSGLCPATFRAVYSKFLMPEFGIRSAGSRRTELGVRRAPIRSDALGGKMTPPPSSPSPPHGGGEGGQNLGRGIGAGSDGGGVGFSSEGFRGKTSATRSIHARSWCTTDSVSAPVKTGIWDAGWGGSYRLLVYASF
jgi:hypothetical protein